MARTQWKKAPSIAIHAAHLVMAVGSHVCAEGSPCKIGIRNAKKCGEASGGVCLCAASISIQQTPTVEALAITIFLSLCLAGFFVVMFLGSGHRARHSLEQEALMPLDEVPAPRSQGAAHPPSNPS
jgi:hypothetical protein